jgi:hypothetical protein
MPMIAIRLLSRLGRRYPLPATKYFVFSLLGSVIGFFALFIVVTRVIGVDKAQLEAMPVWRSTVQICAIACGLVFMGSSGGITARAVFFNGGRKIVDYNKMMGVIVSDRIIAMTDRAFSDGCIVLLWIAVLATPLVAFIETISGR